MLILLDFSSTCVVIFPTLEEACVTIFGTLFGM